MVYKPIVVVMEDEEEVQETNKNGHKKNSNSKLPREISTQKSIIQNCDRKHSIVSFINQEKCPRVIALWEGEHLNRCIWLFANVFIIVTKVTLFIYFQTEIMIKIGKEQVV